MLTAVLAAGMVVSVAAAQGAGEAPAVDPQAQFGGAYAGLDTGRQRLVDDWVARFNRLAGQDVEAAPFYDTVLTFSTKTTFEAVTHALMTTVLTDASGAPLGSALDLVERVDAVRGQVAGASSDRQFRMYVLLKADATGVLERSQQFRRGRDNTIFHKGYPINYRGQGGTPSIQISTALDHRHADIDVDYRSASLPASIFNGHLTAANSDVRVGNNFDRHSERWSGLQSWWRSFLGVSLRGRPVDDLTTGDSVRIPTEPRVGARPIHEMAGDFLKAWMIEGDIPQAMAYVSDRAYSCLAAEADDPSVFDRGMAPFALMGRLKAAHDSLGRHDSLQGLTVGVRLSRPGLRLVNQPNHAQYVVYSVRDDVTAGFDCHQETRPATVANTARAYENYHGTVFHVAGAAGPTVALLWARENGYWKIVSWKTDAGDEPDRGPAPDDIVTPAIVRVPTDLTLVRAATAFLEDWLVRKDYARAFAQLSPASYACYNLYRHPSAPPAGSDADAAGLLGEGMARVGAEAGKVLRLRDVITAADPVHPAVRAMRHASSGTLSLVAYPDSFGQLVGCGVSPDVPRFDPAAPQVYGNIFGMNVRFLTGAGEGPVMRTIWQRDAGQWRIASYHIEYP
jgi:hypothetical protein